MFRQIITPLIMPAPVVARAQLDQYGQMLGTATVGTPFPVNLNIVTSLFLHGNI